MVRSCGLLISDCVNRKDPSPYSIIREISTIFGQVYRVLSSYELLCCS